MPTCMSLCDGAMYMVKCMGAIDQSSIPIHHTYGVTKQATARLLRLGADARLRDGEGKTAWDYAQERGHAACEVMLQEVRLI